MRPTIKPFIFLLVLFGCVTAVLGMTVLSEPVAKHTPTAPAPAPVSKTALYDSLRLDTMSLSPKLFYLLCRGTKMQDAGELSNSRMLTIVDFSLPSSRKRLFIIDMESKKLLYNTYVSHGRNSGTDMATRFSNRPESFQSSLGFYITGNTYNGKNGYSLRLDGMEQGINDNALERAIVMHGSAYVNDRIVHAKGYIGRSLGCPAIPAALAKVIINTIRNGSCLFIYGHDTSYLAMSKMLSQPGLPSLSDTMMADSMG
ncbi:murein L,D-transpeptidase catalytic domain family protein [Paraflavitalea speifideaquila]|uniref:murein L,D-transpeptidase catalytic domain family protein n=1 Tax=Paraflavitalea speifideaquila TaxID=3076558 RepID=UPI0028EA2510|nr:murein L,D-transpeptidase catalytic domain family protein [Paraflavitalea speifideiaquila]